MWMLTLLLARWSSLSEWGPFRPSVPENLNSLTLVDPRSRHLSVAELRELEEGQVEER